MILICGAADRLTRKEAGETRYGGILASSGSPSFLVMRPVLGVPSCSGVDLQYVSGMSRGKVSRTCNRTSVSDVVFV
jgi:hypothetical protein